MGKEEVVINTKRGIVVLDKKRTEELAREIYETIKRFAEKNRGLRDGEVIMAMELVSLRFSDWRETK